MEVSGDTRALSGNRAPGEPFPLIVELGQAALQLCGDRASPGLGTTGVPDEHQVGPGALGLLTEVRKGRGKA